MSSVFPSKFAEEVFDDLKNATNELIRHEESTVHKKAIVALLAWKQKGERVKFLDLSNRWKVNKSWGERCMMSHFSLCASYL